MMKNPINSSAGSEPVKLDEPRSNPFTRPVNDGETITHVPDSHPIDRNLSAEAFNLKALQEAGLDKKSTRPFSLPSLNERLSTLESMLENKLAEFNNKKAADAKVAAEKQAAFDAAVASAVAAQKPVTNNESNSN